MQLRSSLALSLACAIIASTAGNASSADRAVAGSVPCAVIVRDRSGASFEAAVAAAEAAGARGMHLLPPEAFFARFPERPSASTFAGLPVDLVDEAGRFSGRGLDLVVETALEGLFGGRLAATGDTAPAAGEPIEDVLLRVPPDVIRATTAPGPRLGSPREMTDRGANQNSEFMIGNVLVNIIFPESVSGSESWTDQEIANAIADMIAGIQEYSNRAAWMPAPLRFVYNYRDFSRVPVSIEPIESSMATDHIWIGEALANLGYTGGAYFGTHQLNNATRSAFKTDWVFTAFIVDMSAHYDPNPPRPDPGCWGGAGYVAYAYLGGPYIVVPYPACRYGYGLGFGRVFIHEMSHTFWALDEYASAETSCTERSGYLNVPTLNTLYRPEVCGSTPVPCIMQTASPPFASPQPICETTQGQVGIAGVEIGPLTVPSIYSIAPTITFLVFPGISTDTLLPDDEYILSARVTNAAVPNKNSQQDPSYRIDYAAALARGEISINGASFSPIAPSSGDWDSAREDIGLILPRSNFQPGMNTIALRVRNIAGLETVGTTQLFAIGLRYFLISAEPDTDRVKLSWVTSGEVFGAAFSILRSDDTIGERDVVVAVVSEPETAMPDRRSYGYADTLVRPGHRYRYRIVGSFAVDFRGEHREYEFPSSEMSVTSMIPVARGALVSNLLPNPTTGTVAFTVEVPMSYQRVDDSRAQLEDAAARRTAASIPIRTSVEVAVYNVLGQRLRTIFSGSRFGGYMSFAWDGTSGSGNRVPPGVYFISVMAGGERDVRKVVIVR
jgi:hypothetical protein